MAAPADMFSAMAGLTVGDDADDDAVAMPQLVGLPASTSPAAAPALEPTRMLSTSPAAMSGPGAPPELLPAEPSGGLGGPPELLALEEPSAAKPAHAQPPQAANPWAAMAAGRMAAGFPPPPGMGGGLGGHANPFGGGGGGTGGTGAHDQMSLQMIRHQKEALMKQIEKLQGEEERLTSYGPPPGAAGARGLAHGPPGGMGGGMKDRSGGAPPDLIGLGLTPTQQDPLERGGKGGRMGVGGGGGGGGGPGLLTPDQAARLAAMGGWPFGSTPFGGAGAGLTHPTHGIPLSHMPHGMGGGGGGGKVDNATMVKRMKSSHRFLDFVRDPHALVWVQRVLEEGATDEIAAIFRVVMDEPPEIYTDPTSSNLIPALFTWLDDHQRLLLVEKLAQNMSIIAYNMHGTRVVQKTIEQIKPNAKDQIRHIIAALQHQVPNLIKDLNGNHIIQEVLQSFSPEENQFVHDALLTRVVEFGTHRHGCCVLQRCIEYGSDEQKMRLVGDIINNGLCLVQDPFGNYLLQYILEMDVDFINVRVIRQFLKSIPALSINKFASNVIEKCLKIAPDDVRQSIIDEICDRTKLPHLLQDQYANYVIQTALQVCNQQQFYQLQHSIRNLMHLIKNTPHGKRIETKLRTRTFDTHPSGGGGIATPPRQGGFGRGGDSLGVTPDGQWLRGGGGPSQGKQSHAGGTPNAHLDPSATPPGAAAFLPSQVALGRGGGGGGGGGGFRLNANARPFMSPPSGSRQSGTPDKDTSQSSDASTAVKSLHPALIFGGLDD